MEEEAEVQGPLAKLVRDKERAAAAHELTPTERQEHGEAAWIFRQGGLDFSAALRYAKRALYRPPKSPIAPTKEPYLAHQRAVWHPPKSPISLTKEPYSTHQRAVWHPLKSPIAPTKEPGSTLGSCDPKRRACERFCRVFPRSQKDVLTRFERGRGRALRIRRVHIRSG